MIRLSGDSWERRVRSSRVWGDDEVGGDALVDGGLTFTVLEKDLRKTTEMARMLLVDSGPRDPVASRWMRVIL